ncbi:MAG: molybdopterin-dependent oxidoreductase [Haloplanus sp.]
MRSPIRSRAVVRAVLAGVAAVAGSFAVAGNTPAFVVAPVSAFVVNATPAPVVAFSIQRLGHLGDRLAFAFSVALTLAVLAAATWVGSAAGGRTGVRFADAAGAGAAVWAVTALLTGRPTMALASGVPVVAVVGVTARPETAADPSATRRRLVGTAAGVLGFGFVAYLLGRGRTAPAREPMPAPPETTRLAAQAREKELGVDTIPGLVSDAADFYEVDVNSIDPVVDADEWELSVHGAVEESFTLDYADLRGMPAETKFKTLRCVGEQLNAHLMDNAIWTGVPIRAFVERAGPRGGCECVMLRAADGYFEQFPIDALETGFLAYGMNGESLPRDHGYPVRALIPGHWGEINVKWLTEIEVLDERTSGYWENRGWHGTGPVNTVAKIWAVDHLDDGSVRVAGHAYAGTRGIERVEVSTDGGTTWADATLSPALDETDVLGELDAWRQWQFTWAPPSGERTVLARAIDGTGAVQPREGRSPFPNGASGWVSVTVSA